MFSSNGEVNVMVDLYLYDCSHFDCMVWGSELYLKSP